MGLNPFGSDGDYPGMLNKIATYTFVASLLSVWLLRAEFRPVEEFLKPFSLPIPLAPGLSIPIGTILPAFVFAFLSRVVKLHDRLSDLLRIRARFDVRAILLPMAAATGANISIDKVRKISQEREALMNSNFYAYASSTSGKAEIDSHYITMALDQWSWYWIVLEAAFIAFALGVAFLLTGRLLASSLLFLGVIAAIALLQAVRASCTSYALREVELILADPKRKASIVEAFRAL